MWSRFAMVATVPDAVRAKIISSIPVGRRGEPEEIAQAVVCLTSALAAFFAGSVPTMNSG